MNFKISIFGVPHGFDIYEGSYEERDYFKAFYTKSVEDSKLTVHRTQKQVSYNYLKYNLLSGEDRGGAFFGISVVFEGQYCYDVIGLGRLFDAVYETILDEQLLLRKSQDNDGVQAVFQVREFEEEPEEIERIKYILDKNIRTHFSKDLVDIPPSFKGGEDIIKKIPADKGNGSAVSALKKYAWVSISVNYKEELNELNEGGKKKIKENIERVVKSLLHYYDLGAEIGNTQKFREEFEELDALMEADLETLRAYMDTQNDLTELHEDIVSNKDKLNKLKDRFDAQGVEQEAGLTKVADIVPEESTSTSLENVEDNSEEEEGDADQTAIEPPSNNAPINEDQNEGEENADITKTNEPETTKHDETTDEVEHHGSSFMRPIYWFLILISAVTIGGLLWYFSPDKIECTACMNLESTGDYDQAIDAFERFGRAEGVSVESDVKRVKGKAIEKIKDDVASEFDNPGGELKAKFTRAEEKLRVLEKYGENPDDLIKGYRDIVVSGYHDRINSVSQKQEKLGYIGIILSLDPDNSKALELSKQLNKPRVPVSTAKTNKTQRKPEKLNISVLKGNKAIKVNSDNVIPVFTRDFLIIKIDKPEKGGKWKYAPCMELGNISSSPTKIRLLNVGECTLSYRDAQGRMRASVTFLASNKTGLNDE